MRKLIVLLVFAGALVSAKAQILPLDKQRLSALKEAYLHNNEQAVKMVGFYEGMAVKLMKDKLLLSSRRYYLPLMMLVITSLCLATGGRIRQRKTDSLMCDMMVR